MGTLLDDKDTGVISMEKRTGLSLPLGHFSATVEELFYSRK